MQANYGNGRWLSVWTRVGQNGSYQIGLGFFADSDIGLGQIGVNLG